MQVTMQRLAVVHC